MAKKMPKRVKKPQPPDVIEGSFTVVADKPVVPVLALPAPAPVKSDLWKRMDAAKERARAKRPNLDLHVKATPPVAVDDIAGETVVAGKTVTEWAAVVAERMEAGGIIDLTDLPAWVSWAVDVWKRKGSPTAASIMASKVTALRADAEELRKFASMDKNTAVEEHKAGNKGKSEKLLAAAAKKEAKADEKWEEARKLSQEWQEGKAA
jgi:hypothetical protein